MQWLYRAKICTQGLHVDKAGAPQNASRVLVGLLCGEVGKAKIRERRSAYLPSYIQSAAQSSDPGGWIGVVGWGALSTLSFQVSRPGAVKASRASKILLKLLWPPNGNRGEWGKG